jgi:two-component system, OmpR family, phosphate regulon sensor histidine kinase PhoR
MTDYARLLEKLDIPSLLVSGQRTMFANAAATSLLGGHIIGQDIRMAIRIPEAVAAIARAEEGHTRITGMSVPGSIWDMQCHHLDAVNLLVTFEDISVQVSVARAHADFVANASHELRTPLASILGYVETLSDQRAGADPKTRERFLGIIRTEAVRMQDLVEDLMSLSRIEASKHELPNDAIDIVKIARSILGEVKDRAPVVLEANADTAVIAGDNGQIAQVLRNLVDNAIKYGGSKTPVRIIIEKTATGWVSLNVRDEGEGIAPEHLPRLTERFYRADAGRSRAIGGTGLGLSIVKHIVERHKGRFDIVSRPGKGTTASIMLKAREV